MAKKPKKKKKLEASSQIKLEQSHHLTHPPMATPTLSTVNFTRVNAADSTTGWSDIGGGPGSGVNSDVLIQGTGSIGRRIDANVRGFALDLGGSTLNFADGGTHQSQHIFFWVNILQPDLINGMWLRISEDASVPNAGNSLDYEIFPANPYKGGWFRAVVDPRVVASVENGTISQINGNLNAIRWLAFIFDMGNVGGTSQNCLIDAIDRGRGLIVTGGTASDKVTWADIAAVATSNTNAFGLIEERSGVFFMKGEWQFGDATNNIFFEDTDQTVVWENVYTVDRFTTPNTISSQANDLNKLILVEGSGTSDFICGIKSGTGNDATGINGVSYQTAPTFNGVRTRLTIDFSDPDITNVELFGCRFRGCLTDGLTDISVAFSNDATNGPNHEISGCTFDQCGLVDPGRTSQQNNIFSNTLQSSKAVPFEEVHWEDNSAASFTDITTGANTRNNAGTNMFSLATDVTDDAIYFGFRDRFPGLLEHGSLWSDSISSPVWEYWDGTAWTSLGTVTRTLTSNGSTTTNNIAGAPESWPWQHTWTVPADWEKTSVNSGNQLFFVRLRNGADQGTTTGNAIMYWCHALVPQNGAAMLWNSNIDVVNSDFIANADPDTDEKAHGIEHREEGTVSYNGLTFAGSDADILLSDASTLTDNYDFVNGDTNQVVGNGTVNGIAQSITGDGRVLSKAKFNMLKTGTPTGNAIARLYAHSGTFGTSSVPTGAALAVSANFDVSTLTGSFQEIEFDFTDAFTLVNTTNYVIAVEYTGGDGSNNITVESDSSAPTHGGNMSEDTGSWAADSGRDLVFEIWTDILVVNASGGANPTTSTIIDKGQVIINNTINVTLTGLIASPPTEVRVYTADTTDEVAGQEDVVTGSFTFQGNASDVVDIRIHNVEYERADILDFTIPASDVSIPVQQRFDRNYDNP